jgi:hypothetical protein
MRVNKRVNSVVIPCSVVLTGKVLSQALLKLSTEEIETSVDLLIEELDCRLSDADLEDEFYNDIMGGACGVRDGGKRGETAVPSSLRHPR